MAQESQVGGAGETRREHGVWQRIGSSMAVLVAGLGSTLLVTQLYYRAQMDEARGQFEAWSEERQQSLSKAIDAHIEALYGVRALFDSSEYVSPQEFSRFTNDAGRRHRYLRSLGYLRYVTGADRAQFEARYSETLGRSFTILDPKGDGTVGPAAMRSEYLPLLYTQAGDDAPLGLDTLQLPVVAAALKAARESATAKALIVPAQVSPEQSVFRYVHVYLPVYVGPAPTTAAAAAETPVSGYVRLRFVLEEMTDEIETFARNMGVEMTLFESTEGSQLADDPRDEFFLMTGSGELEWAGKIAIADRNFLLRFRTAGNYAGQKPPVPFWLLFAAGLAATLLGTVAMYFITRNRLRAESMSQDLLSEMRERRRSEQRTAQSEARYRVLIENSPDAILLVKQQRVIFVNRAAVDLFRGRNAEELVGRGADELVHPDYKEQARERIRRMEAEQVILPPFEERLFRLDGSVVEVEVRSVPFAIDGETMLQVTIRDITARRQAERERMSLETALRQSQRLEAIGTLTGGIAHDFNNILSSIVGNIRLVMDDLPKGHPARQSAHEIRNATNRARDLVKRLMAFSRQQEAPRSPLELAPLIEEVQQLLRPALPAGVVLHSSVPVDTPPVMGDATQLHQVLVNLCTNAWQSMATGRGEIHILVSTLTAEEARRQSRAALDGAAVYVRIEVRDNGGGIPADIIDRIFEPFFTTKPAGEGSGLGLAVVHGIIQSHKGAISVVSPPGVGTSFLIYLPASDQPISASSAAEASSSRGSNQHILYVDDEESLVVLVTRILERNGYRCTGMTDARAAVELVKQDAAQFDLVLTDMNMPGMSGIDVAREVMAIRRDLPVVITTGYVRATDVAVTREIGVRDLILKPDTIEELANTIARYLREPVRTR
ncbi:PAS domain S-box-containing protein [Povalibacter uvarum]|uniref:histidine kinase n=1 Tax=Povalibacter uvarum TaxID=732238 RepID=A0A841HTN6_9GAMM|nr:ATP-binding protein [Povalibacter uvarum]MBB6095352.1 PAS domain S-box-containing protein [Povalibacter uvarum]